MKKNKGFINDKLTKVLVRAQIICWYGFRNETADFGIINLVNGPNMSGKSTLLDAIKYGLFGDSEFNISASSTGGSEGRTVNSYTECLLSRGGGGVRARSGMIYTHLAFEFHDIETDEYFVCDALIVSDGSTHTHKTYRFLFENTRIEDIIFYETNSEGKKVSLDEKEFAAKNGNVKMMKAVEGVEKFSDKMGLKLDKRSMTAYLAKIRGLVNYDPNDNIPTLIKKGVLEERPADIKKLRDAKKSYEETGRMLERVREENELLDEILDAADRYETITERVTKEEIKQDYKEYKTALMDLESAAKEIDRDIRRSEALKDRKKEAERLSREANGRLADAKAEKGSLVAAYKVDEQERNVNRLRDKVDDAKEALDKLKSFGTRLGVSRELVPDIDPSEETLVRDITTTAMSREEKENILLGLKEKAENIEEQLAADKFSTGQELNDLVREASDLKKELDDIKNRNYVPAGGQAGMALRDEINAALISEGYKPEAKMAYEYVDSIEDEAWRFAIEAKLGRKRFTVIVSPECYDFAYSIQMRTGNRKAVLARTPALACMNVRVGSNDLATMLNVPNPIARTYFDYYLRYSMVDPADVRDYDHAVAKNGFYSDVTYTGYLEMSKSDRFCIGIAAPERSAELIRERLKDVDVLKTDARAAFDEAVRNHNRSKQLFEAITVLLDGEVDLAAGETLATAQKMCSEEEKRLKEMNEALSKDPKANELQAKVDAAEAEATAALNAVTKISSELSVNNEIIEKHRAVRDAAEMKLEGDEDASDEEARIGLRQIMEDHKEAHEKEALAAIKEYDEFLESGKEGSGVLSKSRMGDYRTAQKHAAEELARGQAVYGDRYHSLGRGTEAIEPYRLRKAQVEVTELEKAKAAYLLRRKNCFTLFNTEFLLFIRGCVDDAMKEMRALNDALAKIGFRTTYKLEFTEKRDGTKFETILRQSKRRAVYGDRLAGNAQMSLADVPGSAEDGDQDITEAEMENLMDSIINDEDFSQFEDYRNYLEYDVILEGSEYPEGGARLTEEHGGNSGAGRQIPYTIILTCGLLNLYNRRKSCTRLLFMDEPFKTLDADNVDTMLRFFKEQNLQCIFVAGNKDDEIGPHCDMITPIITGDDKSDMRIGMIRKKVPDAI